MRVSVTDINVVQAMVVDAGAKGFILLIHEEEPRNGRGRRMDYASSQLGHTARSTYSFIACIFGADRVKLSSGRGGSRYQVYYTCC